MQAQADGGWLEASDFIPTAIRLNLTGPLDLAVMHHALDVLKSSTGDLAINLCIESVADRADRTSYGPVGPAPRAVPAAVGGGA